MKRILLAMAGLASLSTVALAADMPVKAPVPLPVNWASLSGFYGGLIFKGGVNHDELVSGLAATTFKTALSGAGGGLEAGYAWNSSRYFVLLDATYTWQNMGTGTVCAPPMVCAVASNWSADLGIDVGFAAPAFTGLLPALGLGGLFPAGAAVPPGATNNGWHPMIGVFGHAEQVGAVAGAGGTGSKVLFQPGVRLSVLDKITSDLVLKTSIQATFSPNKVAFDPTMPLTSLRAGTTITASMSVLTGLRTIGSIVGLGL